MTSTHPFEWRNWIFDMLECYWFAANTIKSLIARMSEFSSCIFLPFSHHATGQKKKLVTFDCSQLSRRWINLSGSKRIAFFIVLLHTPDAHSGCKIKSHFQLGSLIVIDYASINVSTPCEQQQKNKTDEQRHPQRTAHSMERHCSNSYTAGVNGNIGQKRCILAILNPTMVSRLARCYCYWWWNRMRGSPACASVTQKKLSGKTKSRTTDEPKPTENGLENK